MRHGKFTSAVLGCCLTLLATTTIAATNEAITVDKREWVDSSGLLVIEGSLMGFDEETVIIKTNGEDGEELVSLPLANLSDDDKEYLKSREANAAMAKSIEQEQIWTLESGIKALGRVVEFVKADVTVKRRLGKIYVNDQRFENLPEVYQRIVPRIVGHFENENIETEQELLDWLVVLKSRPKTYAVEGVKLEFENGDMYSFPFFLFAAQDKAFLKDGFDRWEAATEDEVKKQQEAMYLEAEARQYKMQQQQEQAQNARVQQMQLQLLAVAADVTDMWEVELIPGPNVYGPVTSMVVVAQNSAQAMQIAANNNPGYGVGAVRKLNRSRSGRRWRW